MTVRHLSTFEINSGLNDAWVNADAPFQGMFISVYPDTGLVFIAWFTFDSELPAGGNIAIFGASDQRWVTGVGVINGNRVELNLELTSGGVFNASDPVATQDTDYGSMTLVFDGCDSGIATFSFTGPALSGSFEIRRAVETSNTLRLALAGSQ